jgi:hypothetical protein
MHQQQICREKGAEEEATKGEEDPLHQLQEPFIPRGGVSDDSCRNTEM